MKLREKIIILILCFILSPFVVEAKESCTIVNGTGNKIGDEISCGEEHFYIIEKTDTELKMLAKYNLYVGAIYNKINLDITKIYGKYECDSSGYCVNNPIYFFDGTQVNSYDEWERKIREKYNLNNIYEINAYDANMFLSSGDIALASHVYSEKYEENNKTYINTTYKLYPYTSITEETEGYALQNKLARGVTGAKGNANYPIYSTTNLFPGNNPNSIGNLDNFESGYTNFEFVKDENNDESIIKKYLYDYQTKLNEMGYEVTKVDMINIKEINNLVHAISNQNLPLSEWYTSSLNSEEITDETNTYKVLGDLKEYLSNDYSWLWNTSYWTKTLAGNTNDIQEHLENYVPNYLSYFVSSSGEICYSRTNCSAGIPRAGLRPIVTISKDDLKYNIYTKTDGNGTIEVVESAYAESPISFKVSAKKGFKLIGLAVTTDSNQTIEFAEENITQDESGTYNISTNNFIMPHENVTIEAKWSEDNIINDIIENPKTGINISLFILVLILISSIYIIIKKKNYLV